MKNKNNTNMQNAKMAGKDSGSPMPKSGEKNAMNCKTAETKDCSCESGCNCKDCDC